MMSIQEIQRILESLDDTFETRVQGHVYQVTKCKLTGQVVRLKYNGMTAIVLGKICKDGRKSFAYIVKMALGGEKYTASRNRFVVL